MLYNRIVYVSSFGFGSNYAFSEFHQQSADVGRIAFSWNGSARLPYC